MMVVMSVTEPRLKPHCVKPQIFTKIYTTCQKLCINLKLFFVWKRLNFQEMLYLNFLWSENLEQNMDILVLCMFWGWMSGKSGISSYLRGGWDSLWEDVKGWGHKKTWRWNKFDICWIWTWWNCQAVDTTCTDKALFLVSLARTFSTIKFRDVLKSLYCLLLDLLKRSEDPSKNLHINQSMSSE